MSPVREMPLVFQSADVAAAMGQRDYVGGTSARLVAVLLAAACAAFGASHVWLRWISLAAFVIAIVIELWLWQTRPDTKWYEGRAAAEKIKTLTWRFAVGAAPFPVSLDFPAAEQLYLERVRAIRERHGRYFEPVDSGGSPPAWLLNLRASSLEKRRTDYLEGRIDDQIDWYGRNAKQNKKRSRLARICILVLDIAGVIMTVLWVTSTITLSLTGILATMVVIVGAYLSLRGFDENYPAYLEAQLDLEEAKTRLARITTEDSWAQEAGDAEEAISREHTGWQASRSR